MIALTFYVSVSTSPIFVKFGNFVIIDSKNNIKWDLTRQTFQVPCTFPSPFLLGNLVNTNPVYISGAKKQIIYHDFLIYASSLLV